MFIIGPLVSPYPVKEYFTNQTTWKYLGTVTIFYNPNELPGVFDTNPSPSGPNGALWTLAAEFFMYIMIALAAFIGLFYKRSVLLCTTVLTIGIYLYNNYGMGSQLSFIYKVLDYFGLASFVSPITGNSQVTAMLMTLFMIGAMYYLYRDRISYKPLYILIAVLLWAPTIVVGGWILQIATFILLPYAILGLAHIKLPYANSITKYGDFSYGFYIYGAPVQQTIVYFLGAISVPVMFCISLICVTPFAVLSWHLVESRALKMKSIDISGMINKGYRSVLTNVNTVWSLENKK
jgi:peptidoglycan/LPS O-acetylase OafA/YrhL